MAPHGNRSRIEVNVGERNVLDGEGSGGVADLRRNSHTRFELVESLVRNGDSVRTGSGLAFFVGNALGEALERCSGNIRAAAVGGKVD